MGFKLTNNGTCERPGWYIPTEDASRGDFNSNKKYYREGDKFSDIMIQIEDYDMHRNR